MIRNIIEAGKRLVRMLCLQATKIDVKGVEEAQKQGALNPEVTNPLPAVNMLPACTCLVVRGAYGGSGILSTSTRDAVT